MSKLTNISFHISLGSNYYPNYSMLSRINKFTNDIVESTVNYIKNKFIYQPCDVPMTKPISLKVIATNTTELQLQSNIRYGNGFNVTDIEITNKSIYSGNPNPIISYDYDKSTSTLNILINSSYSDKSIFLKVIGYKKIGKCNQPYVFTGKYYPPKSIIPIT